MTAGAEIGTIQTFNPTLAGKNVYGTHFFARKSLVCVYRTHRPLSKILRVYFNQVRKCEGLSDIHQRNTFRSCLLGRVVRTAPSEAEGRGIEPGKGAYVVYY